jgi:GNAT superfamily N-acetyltransferase
VKLRLGSIHGGKGVVGLKSVLGPARLKRRVLLDADWNRLLMLVAEVPSIGLVGHICAGIDRESVGGLAGTIRDLTIDPSAEPGDVTKRLVQGARKWLEDRGVTKIKVNVPAGNQQAERLFEQLGFQSKTIEMSLESTGTQGPDAPAV